jgi:hypothetical protein
VGFLILVAIIFIGAPIGRAIATRIARGAGAGDAPALRRALEEMEQRLVGTEHRLDDALERLGETEERLDFTERLLTRLDSQRQLKSGE